MINEAEIQSILDAEKTITTSPEWSEITAESSRFIYELKTPLFSDLTDYALQLKLDAKKFEDSRTRGSACFMAKPDGQEFSTIGRMEILNVSPHTNKRISGAKDTDLTFITVPENCVRIYTWEDNKHIPHAIQKNLPYCREITPLPYDFKDAVNKFLDIMNINGFIVDPPNNDQLF